MGNLKDLFQIDVIVDKCQILLDLLSRISEEFRGLRRVSGSRHAVQNGRAGDRQVVKIVLEVLVTSKSQSLNDADDVSRSGCEPARHVAHVEQDKVPRTFEDGP